MNKNIICGLISCTILLKSFLKTIFFKIIILSIIGFSIYLFTLFILFLLNENEVTLKDYKYIKDIKVQLEDIKNKKSNTLIIRNVLSNGDIDLSEDKQTFNLTLTLENEKKVNKILNFIEYIYATEDKITKAEQKDLIDFIFEDIDKINLLKQQINSKEKEFNEFKRNFFK